MHSAPQTSGQEKLQAWARSLRHPAPTIKGHIRLRSPPGKLPFFFFLLQLPRSVINFEIRPPATATTPPQPSGHQHRTAQGHPTPPAAPQRWVCRCLNPHLHMLSPSRLLVMLQRQPKLFSFLKISWWLDRVYKRAPSGTFTYAFFRAGRSKWSNQRVKICSSPPSSGLLTLKQTITA